MLELRRDVFRTSGGSFLKLPGVKVFKLPEKLLEIPEQSSLKLQEQILVHLEVKLVQRAEKASLKSRRKASQTSWVVF